MAENENGEANGNGSVKGETINVVVKDQNNTEAHVSCRWLLRPPLRTSLLRCVSASRQPQLLNL